MCNKKTVILGQDKNYKGKIPTKVLKEAINKLKKRAQEHYDSTTSIGGFEVNGGTGLTKTGLVEMENFDTWARERGQRAVYNSMQDMEVIRNNLRVSIKFKDKQK